MALNKSKLPKKSKVVKEGKRGKKAKKDGPQVKRASSAYIHFTTDFRKMLKEKCEKNGDPLPKANEVAKMAGEQWKKLTEEERKPYNQKAQLDKERYLKEVSKVLVQTTLKRGVKLLIFSAPQHGRHPSPSLPRAQRECCVT